MTGWTLALLVGCQEPASPWYDGPEPAWQEVAVGRAGPPAGFSVEASDAIIGEGQQYTITGAASGLPLNAFRTRHGLGAGSCYAEIGGQCLDLTPRIRPLWDDIADPSGDLVVDVPIPDRPALVGVEACVQVVASHPDPSDSEISPALCFILDYDDDGDGANNTYDACPGFDDAVDADGDGEADGCDPTPQGLCTGVTCEASDACHVASVCDLDDGTCSDPIAPDATQCDVDGGTGECVVGACEVTACGDGYLFDGASCVQVWGPARASCTAHYDAGERTSGLYFVDPLSTGVPRAAWCDLTDGGWTLVMRAYGGHLAGEAWQTAGALGPTLAPAPSTDESFKFSDAEINALRGAAGPYRLAYNGDALPITPPQIYVSGQCTYQHLASRLTETVANRACRTWSLSADLSSPTVSATNGVRKGIIVGSPTVGNGFLSYLTNFDINDPARDGWYVGDIDLDSGWCVPNEAGCDMVMYVKSAPGLVTRESCTAHYLAGETRDGLYSVNPLGTGSFDAWCDMSGGGWTMVARGYGADGTGWNTTGSLFASGAVSPTMAESMKLSDAAINALRQGDGRYRIRYTGSTSLFTPTPPTVYVPGSCTYNHTAASAGDCLTYSLSSDLSSLLTSLTNVSRKGIVAGSTSSATGFLHYLTNFGTTGWYAGDITQNSDWCESTEAGCDIEMWVNAL